MIWQVFYFSHVQSFFYLRLSLCVFVCLFAWIRPPVVYVAWARAGRRGSLRVHSLWLYSFGSWLTTFAPPLPPPRTRDHVWPLTSGSIVSRIHKSYSPLNNMALNCSYKIWFYTLNLSHINYTNIVSIIKQNPAFFYNVTTLLIFLTLISTEYRRYGLDMLQTLWSLRPRLYIEKGLKNMFFSQFYHQQPCSTVQIWWA